MKLSAKSREKAREVEVRFRNAKINDLQKILEIAIPHENNGWLKPREEDEVLNLIRGGKVLVIERNGFRRPKV